MTGQGMSYGFCTVRRHVPDGLKRKVFSSQAAGGGMGPLVLHLCKAVEVSSLSKLPSHPHILLQHVGPTPSPFWLPSACSLQSQR